MDWMRSSMLARGCIDADDFRLFQVVDEADQVVRIITRHFKATATQPNGSRRDHIGLRSAP